MWLKKITLLFVLSLICLLPGLAKKASPNDQQKQAAKDLDSKELEKEFIQDTQTKTVSNQTAQESDQQINDFSLSGYGERGKKSWELAGKSADIFTDTVKLNDVVGKMYGKEEDVKLTSDTGDFNKANGKVHLEKNVVITTTSGTKLTTDSLDWDRQNQLLTTKDMVNIEKQNMTLVAQGVEGEPSLKKVSLEKNVRLDINPKEETNKAGGMSVKEKIIITCDGPLEVDYEKNIASFNNNVKVDRQDSVIYSDKMDIYFIADKSKKESESQGDPKGQAGMMGNKIEKIIARGNVKVVRGENISYSEEAIYSAADKKLILSGRPKLVISSSEGMNMPSLNK